MLAWYRPWGLRIGLAVFGVCTTEVTWQHVLTIAEANPWDLSGMEIMGETELWTWPDDVSGLAGQCGHLLQSGSDPFLCAAGAGKPAPTRPSGPGTNQTFPAASTTSASRTTGHAPIGLLALLGALSGTRGILTSPWGAGFPILWAITWVPAPADCSPADPDSSRVDDCPIVPLVNSTRGCMGSRTLLPGQLFYCHRS